MSYFFPQPTYLLRLLQGKSHFPLIFDLYFFFFPLAEFQANRAVRGALVNVRLCMYYTIIKISEVYLELIFKWAYTQTQWLIHIYVGFYLSRRLHDSAAVDQQVAFIDLL